MLVGYYGGSTLRIDEQLKPPYSIFFADGLELIGFKLNTLPIIPIDFKIEDDTIFVSSNEKIIFESGYLRHVSGKRKYPMKYHYGIGKGQFILPRCNLDLYDCKLGKEVGILENNTLYSAYIKTYYNYDDIKKMIESKNALRLAHISPEYSEKDNTFLELFIIDVITCLIEKRTVIRYPSFTENYFCGLTPTNTAILSRGPHLFSKHERKMSIGLLEEGLSPISEFEDLQDFLSLCEIMLKGKERPKDKSLVLTNKGMVEVEMKLLT